MSVSPPLFVTVKIMDVVPAAAEGVPGITVGVGHSVAPVICAFAGVLHGQGGVAHGRIDTASSTVSSQPAICPFSMVTSTTVGTWRVPVTPLTVQASVVNVNVEGTATVNVATVPSVLNTGVAKTVLSPILIRFPEGRALATVTVSMPPGSTEVGEMPVMKGFSTRNVKDGPLALSPLDRL